MDDGRKIHTCRLCLSRFYEDDLGGCLEFVTQKEPGNPDRVGFTVAKLCVP